MLGRTPLHITGGVFTRRAADLGLVAGRVVEIGPLPGAQAREEIDATGRIVMPGIIDNIVTKTDGPNPSALQDVSPLSQGLG